MARIFPWQLFLICAWLLSICQKSLSQLVGLLQGPCFSKERSANLKDCHDFIREVAENPDTFWYGRELERLCEDNETPRNATCFNPLPHGAPPFSYQTLGSRLFVDKDYRSAEYLSELNATVDVIFDSPPGLSTFTAVTKRSFCFGSR